MKEKLNFEQANEKLEKIVKEMESGQSSLEESIKLYEEAFNLLSFCYKHLEESKGKIEDINQRITILTKSEKDLFNE